MNDGSKHTPGEWRVSDDGIHIQTMGGTIIAACVRVPEGLGGGTEGNPPLLAAAPKLLEACERIATVNWSGPEEAMRVLSAVSAIARAAIAKARLR